MEHHATIYVSVLLHKGEWATARTWLLIHLLKKVTIIMIIKYVH